jgi:two-component sensor histidine kinase
VVTIQNRGAYYVDHSGKHSVLGVMFDVSDERAARERQRAALAEKELLLKEIHHRVKNNFQIISSLLRLEQDRVPDDLARGALIESERRIFAMALVHESMYQQGDFGHIDFKPYALKMGRELLSVNRGSEAVRFEVVGDELPLGLDTAVPLGLLLNEALQNAFKHAFPMDFTGERTILVRITNDVTTREVCVQDSGIGMGDDRGVPADGKAKPESSLGMTLMKLLADQLGGTLSIDAGRGIAVRVSLPLTGS